MDEIIILALAKKYTDSVGEKVSREGFHVQVEQDRSILNGTGQEKIFYFLPKTSDNPTDGYDEFVYTNNNWEQVGVTDIDLSSYATKAEVGNLNNLPTTDKSSIVSAISETFTSVSNGKSLVASAITDKGVPTSSDATFEIMAQNIASIPTGGGSVEKKDVNFYDWEGTLLFGYSVEEVQAMTSLPAPDTSPNYQTVDHDLLVFQEWTRNLTNIKTWVQNHSDQSLGVGAIYTTTDGQNHNHWNNPRLTNVKSIYLQKRGATSIGNDAFNSCYSLTSINIPDGVTSIGSSVFRSCYSLTAINIPDGVTSIGTNAFQNCYSLTAINIPNGVTSIGGGAFRYCYSLTSINIPDEVASIGGNAFQNCYSLTAINIPNGVTSIDGGAFGNCYSLTSINIPDGVTSIDGGAFQNCRELYDVVIHGKPALSNTNAFNGAPSTQKFYVHRSDLSWFETATNWSTIYAQGKIVAAADYLDHLISIGIDVTDFENEVITT